ncbi:MAG: ATP-binding protein [Ruminiclostridium sp.]|nr:ATP-binding protein [Ruminiclostridium sp.]MBP3857674.1 ATP-binding protein [Ruminiclostridium sp.]
MLTRELETAAAVSELDNVIDFVDGQLEAVGCSIDSQMQIELAVEEIFVNIASYAYAPGIGNAAIKIRIYGEPPTVEITFTDHGVRYDPLAKEDPDIDLPAGEREVGGLGIFLAKKNMDEMAYEYRDGMNIFTMKKVIN